jgi:hypothetical protein
MGGGGGGGGGGEGWIFGEIPPKHTLLGKTGLFRGEAAFSVQIFPWETEFMNNALWSPRGAQAGERTRTAGGTELYKCNLYRLRLSNCLKLILSTSFSQTRDDQHPYAVADLEYY